MYGPTVYCRSSFSGGSLGASASGRPAHTLPQKAHPAIKLIYIDRFIHFSLKLSLQRMKASKPKSIQQENIHLLPQQVRDFVAQANQNHGKQYWKQHRMISRSAFPGVEDRQQTQKNQTAGSTPITEAAVE
jgi:hypothetical protein